MEAEFLGLVEGLRIASVRSQSRECCEAYVDVKPLRDKLRGNERRCGDWRDYYESYEWLSSKFDSCEVYYVNREQNTDAHTLARNALKRGRKSL